MRRAPVAALLAAALVLAGVPAVVGAGGASGPHADGPGPGVASNASGSARAAQSGAIERTFGLSRLPDDPGVIRVQVRHEIPDSVTTLSTTVPENATVVRTQGFRRSGDREYEWTRDDDTPSITYRLPVNRTAERDGGGYLFVDTGSWAIVTRPRMPVSYSGTGERPEVVDSLAVDGTGAAGGDIAYLGEYREHSREAGGQRFRLVVPAAAAPAERPADVFDGLAQVAERDLGPRDDEVFVVAAPTTVRWGATGLQRGAADLWVRDVERLDSPDSVWLHEYVHTRQVYSPESGTRWTVEGMADYYAALGALEQGHIDYDRFRRHLSLGRQYEDAVLADPDTWEGTLANYHKGTLVMAAVDRRIRLATDRERTLADVLARVNAAGDDGDLTRTEFLDAVEAVAGPEVRAYARKHTETDAAPETWNRSEHMAAFGQPDIRYAFDGVEVAGPYRNGTYDAPPTLVPGERLTVRVRVENAGTAPGEYRATLRAGGDEVDTRSGTLGAGEAATLRYEVPVEEADSFDVEVAGLRQSVAVRRPAAPRVTDVAAPAEVAPGEQFRIDAAVANPADRPADGEVPFSAGDERVVVRQVRLAPDETAGIGATAAFEDPGEYTVSAGDRETSVRAVADRTPRDRAGVATATAGPATGGDGQAGTGTGATAGTPGEQGPEETPAPPGDPGLGAAAVLTAVVLVAALVLATGVLRGRVRR